MTLFDGESISFIPNVCAMYSNKQNSRVCTHDSTTQLYFYGDKLMNNETNTNAVELSFDELDTVAGGARY